MADYTEKSSLEQFAEVLISHGVEFIVVGGQAEILFGSSRSTYDVDLCYRRTQRKPRAFSVRTVGDLDLRVISIDDLIAIKQHIQRPKDRDSLMHLLAIKKVLSEKKSGTE